MINFEEKGLGLSDAKCEEIKVIHSEKILTFFKKNVLDENFEINPYLFHLLRFLHFYIQITHKILSELDDFLSKQLSILPFLLIFMKYFHNRTSSLIL